MFGWQEQSQRSPCLLGGLEYGPQGLGLQGSSSTIGATARTCIMLIIERQTNTMSHLRNGFNLQEVKGSPM